MLPPLDSPLQELNQEGEGRVAPGRDAGTVVPVRVETTATRPGGRAAASEGHSVTAHLRWMVAVITNRIGAGSTNFGTERE